ncbi:phage antirepressor KilAC domain-containing protein [Enterococcus cecorum]|nr:phage antirepressor KilAC domain-containing protein [Enterococcus cecorum]CAI3403918.1 phage antirepressor KilAC domain-containing protein [Enterococcus cecorum]CAI3413614.1 phage antirepressor KilAC domain-containing protein [Enterococcus cecorum]CAI3444703.1 phage antirepressor KilAC domain-containing protein [Enterococcus cecorum]CAI3474382.1 phage antirepressor KilAC domain-containing protein [Enterococcus cecorum]
MMEIQTFNFENQQVRTIEIENEPYFVGKDITEILGYSNSRDALYKHVDEEDKLTSQIATSGQNRNMVVINESGLYSLILSSKLPNAKKFKRWVTSEVLPAIRKHGGYLTEQKLEEALLNPDTLINLATQLKQEREGRLIAEQRVNELTPKASYYDKVLSNKALVTITVIAKDYGMSGKAMNALLHELGVQYKQGTTWLLYARYQKNGWTHSETVMITDKDGNEKAVLNTKWTQKGRLGLYELLKRKGYLPVIERETA